MKVVLIKVKGEEPKVEIIEIENKLESYYKHVDCNLIDIVGDVTIPQVKGKFDLIVDDEGLLIEKPEVSAICVNANHALFGNVIVAKSDEEGKTIGLTDQEAKDIMNHVFIRMTDDLRLLPILKYKLSR